MLRKGTFAQTKAKGTKELQKESEENAKKNLNEIKRRRKRFTYNRLRDKSKVGANLAEVGETQKIEFNNRRIIRKKLLFPELYLQKLIKALKHL